MPLTLDKTHSTLRSQNLNINSTQKKITLSSVSSFINACPQIMKQHESVCQWYRKFWDCGSNWDQIKVSQASVVEVLYVSMTVFIVEQVKSIACLISTLLWSARYPRIKISYWNGSASFFSSFITSYRLQNCVNQGLGSYKHGIKY